MQIEDKLLRESRGEGDKKGVQIITAQFKFGEHSACICFGAFKQRELRAPSTYP